MEIRRPFLVHFLLIALLVPSVGLKAQLSIDAGAGFARNSFFHFKDEKLKMKSIPEWGSYMSLGIKHQMRDKFYATYGISLQKFRAQHSFEETDGRLSNGYDFEFDVNYLAVRLGISQVIVENESFQLNFNFDMVLGFQSGNETSGCSWAFVPVRVMGPNDEEITLFVREENCLDTETYEEILPYSFGSDLGFRCGVYISPQIFLYAESFYSFTFTPFLEPSSPNILRNAINIGLGVSVKLVSE